MSWNPFQKPINYILLAGRKSPGIAEVVGANSPRKWDDQGGYGLAGAWLIFHGNGIAKFQVKLRLYDEQDFADWDAWKPIVQKVPRGARPKALDIWHPLLEDIEIKSVVVEDRTQLEKTNDTGEWTITISFKTFLAPKIAYAKPEESVAATPLTPQEQEVKARYEQYQQLAATTGGA